jgi:hypothetical protein
MNKTEALEQALELLGKARDAFDGDLDGDEVAAEIRLFLRDACYIMDD